MGTLNDPWNTMVTQKMTPDNQHLWFYSHARCSHKACDLAATAHKPCHYGNLIFKGARGYSKCTNFAFLCRRLRHVIPRKKLPGCLPWPQYIRKNLNVHGVVQPQSALESVFPCVFYRFFFCRLCAKDVSQVIHIYTEYRWFPGCGYPTEADQPSKLHFP